MVRLIRLIAALAFGRLAGVFRDVVISAIVPTAYLPTILVTIRWLNSGRSAISDASVYPIFAALSHRPSFAHLIRISLVFSTILAVLSLFLPGLAGAAAVIASIFVALTVFSFLTCAILGNALYIAIYLFVFNLAVAAGAVAFVLSSRPPDHFAAFIAVALSCLCWVLSLVPGKSADEAVRTSLAGSLLAPAAFAAFVIHSPILFDLAGTPTFLIAFYWIERLVGTGAGLVGYALGMSKQASSNDQDTSTRLFVMTCVAISTFALAVCVGLWFFPALDPEIFSIGGFGITVQYFILGLGLSGIALVENVVFRRVVLLRFGSLAVSAAAALGFVPVVAVLLQPTIIAADSQFAVVFLLTMWLKCVCLWSFYR